MTKRTIIFAALLLSCLVLSFPAEAQCAMCKAAAESNLEKNPTSIARGLNSGILYLMAVPYLAIIFIFRKQIWSLWKRLRNKQAA